jgi:hypothetical protein
VFGIKSVAGEKGVFVTGLNAYADSSAAMVLNDLATKGKTEPNKFNSFF